MPLPWTFAHQVLVPVTGRVDARVLVHVRVFTDRWAGAWVVCGVLPGDGHEGAAALMPVVRTTLEERLIDDAAMWVSYQPADREPFRSHRDRDDATGHTLPDFVAERAPRDVSATGTRLLRCGPIVDVWKASDYTVRTFSRKTANASS